MKVTETQAEDVYIKAGRGNAKHRSQWIKEGKGEIKWTRLSRRSKGQQTCSG
jgi:hypothetical protein